MAYLEKAGEFQLKPIEWAPYTYPDGGEALRFVFVDKDGLRVDGTIGYTKKDGSTNENIELFSKALEEGKSLLCEVQQGKPKTNGGHFYSVKWAVTKKSDANTSTSAADLKAFLAKRSVNKPAAPHAHDSDIPF